MDMQTGSKNDIPSGNFAVAVVQSQIFRRSSISGFIINKNNGSDYSDTINSGARYNRVAGLEYNLATPDKRWTGKAFITSHFTLALPQTQHQPAETLTL
jgi:hypothetical protein